MLPEGRACVSFASDTAGCVRQVYEPHDYLALYGKDPLNDFQLGGTHYVATGDSGQAMTGAALAAMVLGAEILGTANEFGEARGAPVLRRVFVHADT